MATLDKNVLKETRAHYRAWNEDKFVSQVLQSGQITPEEKWLAYKDLYAFSIQIKPTPSLWEQRCAMGEWKEYHDRLRRFEEWRERGG